MTKALLAVLLALPLTLPTTLVLDAPPPTPLVAGQATTLEGTIQLTAPTGPLPGVATDVDLKLKAPAGAACLLTKDRATLDPVTGQAPFGLTCDPTRPGNHSLTVTATSPPHRSGTWNATLPVAPDTLTGQAWLGPVEGYRAPLVLDLVPTHLSQAPVNVTVTSRLTGTPLAFDDHLNATAGGPPLMLDWLARHGPGIYGLTLTAQGPATHPWSTNLTAEVPEPSLQHTEVVNVTVEPGKPAVHLANDAINDDGKQKSPGQNLTTRLQLAHASRANITVARPSPNGSIPLARSIEAGAAGRIEHVFAHAPLPAGTLVVEARVGSSAVQRTANITDLLSSADVVGPDQVLGDGRPVVVALNLSDPNFGSTPMDPGPVFGLPDVTWKVYRGSRVSQGWNVSIGPFTGDSTGTAPLSRLAWPQGAPWATVGSGWARTDVVLVPPPGVAPGTYRLTLYDQEDRRLGSASVELLPPPTLSLTAPVPHPGQAWPVALEVQDPVAEMEVQLAAHLDGEPLANATAAGPTNVTVEVPWGLPAGTPLVLEATAHWPGRPAPEAPDATLGFEVPALPPTLEVAPTVDGYPAPVPVALHPAGAHELALATTAVDPNGDPVEVSHRVSGPNGAEPGWALLPGPLAGYQVPAQAEPGRYLLTVTATAPDGQVERELDLAVAAMARVGVAAPQEVSVEAGETVTVEVTTVNTGTTPLTGLLVDVDTPPSMEASLEGPDGTELPIGAVVPTALSPGQERVLRLVLAADPMSGGTQPVVVTVAGVVP